MAVLNLDLTIEEDRNGEHFVVFPRRFQDLTPPRDHYEKMAWIRQSFEIFYERVCELDSVGHRKQYN